jgi:hypothetical protein
MSRRVAFLFAVVMAWQMLCPAGAQAATYVFPCENFTKNADGSWNVLHTTYLEGPDVKVQDEAVIPPGLVIRSYNIADLLAKACPNAPIAPPPGEAPPPASAAAPGIAPAPAGAPPTAASARPAAPPPQSLLARYADANGNIDIRQLSCANLDDATLEEADLLLAWYSGWYNGLARGHGINLARLRYKSRGVIDYCRGNRDKKLSEVMALMLK